LIDVDSWSFFSQERRHTELQMPLFTLANTRALATANVGNKEGKL